MQTVQVTKGQRNPLHTGFPERLRQAYNGSPLSQAQIAELVGLSHPVLSRMGAHLPGVDTAERLAHGLGVSPCWLGYGTHGTRLFRSHMGPEEEMQQGPPSSPPDPLSSAGLGQRLYAARQRKRMSQRGLARTAGASHTAISNLETGRTMPGVDLCEALARALDVSPCWLAYGESPAKE